MRALDPAGMTPDEAEGWVVRLAEGGYRVFAGNDGTIQQDGWQASKPPRDAATMAILSGQLSRQEADDGAYFAHPRATD